MSIYISLEHIHVNILEGILYYTSLVSSIFSNVSKFGCYKG